MKKKIVILSFLNVLALGGLILSRKIYNILSKEIKKYQSMSDKHLALFLIMNQWVRVKQKGKNLASYLEKNGYKRIAIYGMSYVGETLLDELKGTEIEVAYGIDKKADGMYTDIDIVSPESPLEDVEAIIVTAISFFDEIEETLNKKIKCPVISLEDILFEI